jgi:hypothetical protein
LCLMGEVIKLRIVHECIIQDVRNEENRQLNWSFNQEFIERFKH